MAQLKWVYLSPTNKHYAIGLFHGDNTRHVMVYINNRISVIDFSIKTDKTYTFFIEEELCELSLRREPENWAYDFKINTVIQTPANIVRRKREIRYLIYAVAFLLLFGILVTTLIYVIL